MKPKLVVIEGTNASGKSGLGVALAAHYGGEVVSADSRQVFRGLDLGSGKITLEEMQGVRHHLIDVAEPNEFFSMHDFQRMAYEAVDDIRARGRTPFLVGGTGLYVASVTEGYVMSDTEPDLEYRAYLETMDTPKLYEMLRELRPEMEIDEKNRNRVMRQLEKIHDGDDHSAPNAPRYDCLKLGVTWPRPVLRARSNFSAATMPVMMGEGSTPCSRQNSAAPTTRSFRRSLRTGSAPTRATVSFSARFWKRRSRSSTLLSTFSRTPSPNLAISAWALASMEARAASRISGSAMACQMYS